MMFWMFLLGAMPLDPVGDPLPLYLDQARVRRVLSSIPARLGGCSATADLTLEVRLRLRGEGSIGVDAVEGTEPAMADCIKSAISSMDAPSHDGTDVRVTTTIYRRDGVWMMSPSPRIDRRPLTPLLLFVPGGGDEGASIWRRLMSADESER